VAWPARFLGAAAVATGHLGLIVLLARVAGGWLRGAIGAVGRMALTNYLMQTVICVVIFDGWALGRWGRWSMSELALVVLAVWLLQIIVSPLWLRAFRYGPAEWAWRSLTYWRAQPMRA
jgi:uncharacterized protein